MSYIRNIAILFSSNSLGTLLNFIFLPILSRIYLPEYFGVLAYFLSISLIIGMLVTLKFENIFFIDTEKPNEIMVLIIISIITIELISLIVLSIFWSFNFLISDGTLIIYILIYTFLLGLYYAGRAYLSSIGRFKKISQGYLLKILISNLFFLFGSYIFKPNAKLLIIGTIIGQFSETIYLLSNFRIKDLIKVADAAILKNYVNRYKNFPLFTLPGELLGNINSQLPVFFLSSAFGNTITGYYSLVQRLIGIPLKLLTSSSAEVFRSEAAKKFKYNNSFKDLALKTSKYLFLLALVIGIVLFFASDYLIPIFLGKEWFNTIPFLKVMIILFVFQFSVSPISYGLYVAEKQKVDFFWQLTLVIICFLSLFISIKNFNAINTVFVYSLCYSLMYIVYFFLIISNSERKNVI